MVSLVTLKFRFSDKSSIGVSSIWMGTVISFFAEFDVPTCNPRVTVYEISTLVASFTDLPRIGQRVKRISLL